MAAPRLIKDSTPRPKVFRKVKASQPSSVLEDWKRSSARPFEESPPFKQRLDYVGRAVKVGLTLNSLPQTPPSIILIISLTFDRSSRCVAFPAEHHDVFQLGYDAVHVRGLRRELRCNTLGPLPGDAEGVLDSLCREGRVASCQGPSKLRRATTRCRSSGDAGRNGVPMSLTAGDYDDSGSSSKRGL